MNFVELCVEFPSVWTNPVILNNLRIISLDKNNRFNIIQLDETRFEATNEWPFLTLNPPLIIKNLQVFNLNFVEMCAEFYSDWTNPVIFNIIQFKTQFEATDRRRSSSAISNTQSAFGY